MATNVNYHAHVQSHLQAEIKVNKNRNRDLLELEIWRDTVINFASCGAAVTAKIYTPTGDGTELTVQQGRELRGAHFPLGSSTY